MVLALVCQVDAMPALVVFCTTGNPVKSHLKTQAVLSSLLRHVLLSLLQTHSSVPCRCRWFTLQRQPESSPPLRIDFVQAVESFLTSFLLVRVLPRLPPWDVPSNAYKPFLRGCFQIMQNYGGSGSLEFMIFVSN